MGTNPTCTLHYPSAAQLISAGIKRMSHVCRLLLPKCDYPAPEGSPPPLRTTRPLTSHASGAKMWFLANSSYFTILSMAALSAAAPAQTDVRGRYDAANVSATVTSHAMFLPRPHGTIEAPSGLLLAVWPSFPLNAKQRPAGSFWA